MTEPFLLTDRDKVLRALQLVELEGLMEIDRICRKYGIEYSLGGGTCLGRVRHGGFIPWDDDIDVDMTVDNYDRFMEVAPGEVDTSRFFLRCKATDPNHYRTAAKLEIKDTILEFGSWKNAKIKAGVFVDIFRVNYLPDDEKLRKKIAHRLYMIHGIENYRMLKGNTNALRDNYNVFWWFVSEFVPIKWIMKWDEKIVDKYGKKRTGWLIGDSLASGDYAGYPSNGTDEYEDVIFEGKKVRDKKHADEFLATLYGKNYREWLPPIERISNHKWISFDLGHHKEKLDLPVNYEDFLTIKYNKIKLMQMQSVSLMIVEKVIEICHHNMLHYFVLSDNESEIWKGPLIIGIPRDDYSKFLDVAELELGDEFLIQHKSNTTNYYYSHTKVRLKHTELRDSRLPGEVDRSFHSGFYIDIVPMDSASDDRKKRLKQVKVSSRLENRLIIKWTRNNYFRFRKSKPKTKLKQLLMIGKTAESIYRKLNCVLQKYNNEDTRYYIYSKCEGRGFNTVEKNKVDECRNTLNENTEELIGRLSKRYEGCFLNYYDSDDYQLSVLRYDEKEERMLSNEEIFSGKRK